MSYQLVRSFYVGDTLVSEETDLSSLSKEVIEKGLADGNLVADKGGSESTTPLVAEQTASDLPENTPAEVTPPAPEEPVAPTKPDPQPPTTPAGTTPDQILDDLKVAE